MKLPFNRFNKNDIAFPNVLNWKLNSLVDAFNNDTYKSITWDELYNLCQGETLIPGMTYRLTDYQCTVANDSNARAINEGLFDILIVADDESTLNENVRFTYHDGDTYFGGCNLESWEGKYCIYNDTTRFAWADETNGKGVIYYLKDEYNNECPYDFKNIQFKRVSISNIEATGLTSNMLLELQTTFVYGNNGGICYGQVDQLGSYIPSNVSNNGTIINYTFDNTKENYYYTFTWVDDSGYIQDASIFGQQLTNYNGHYPGVYNNQIQPVFDYKFYPNYISRLLTIALNNIVIISSYSFNSGSFNGCYGNKFGVNCYDNTFGNDCNYNTFGNRCISNTFGDNCRNSTFGNHCNYNTFGNSCGDNTFGDDCYGNIFGNSCFSNKFGNECNGNKLGNYCYQNTFGNGCDGNTFGDDCNYNTFGNDYCNNILGNDCEYNTFGNECNYNTFGSECNYNTFGNGYGRNTFGNSCYYNTFGNYCDSNTFETDYMFGCRFGDNVEYCKIGDYVTTATNQILMNIIVLNGTKGEYNNILNLDAVEEIPSFTYNVSKSTADMIPSVTCGYVWNSEHTQVIYQVKNNFETI